MTKTSPTRIHVLDTTLRDGTQGESVSFSVDDKLTIAEKLDQLGIDYIEGGWPGSNPKDKEFFERARSLNLKHARLSAFGSTRFAKYSVDQDPNVRSLLEAQTPAVCIFGKTWDLHTRKALGVSEEVNQTLIRETVGILKRDGREVIFDAEHFFDGYKGNKEFALRALEAAAEAGADVLCLCDTNGGTMPHEVAEIVADVRSRFGGIIGIHTHNDSGLAVANSLAAVREGATHVQGCLNGYGERCGNANLATVIANLELKMGFEILGSENLANLTSAARFIADLANLPIPNDMPYVGASAFAHKGGVHVAAVLKDASTYEHVRPETVGNRQRVLLSDLSGRGNIFYKLKEHGLEERLSDEQRVGLLETIKQMEHEGYELEAAEGTFELLVREALSPDLKFFEPVSIETTTRMSDHVSSLTTATVAVRTAHGHHTATETGNGPVNALDVCLRNCLSQVFPAIKKVELTDYKVRVLAGEKGTASKVRVLVEWTDHEKWKALSDAIRLELMRLYEAGGHEVARPDVLSVV
jgi:2-isopropylmalate synthase